MSSITPTTASQLPLIAEVDLAEPPARPPRRADSRRSATPTPDPQPTLDLRRPDAWEVALAAVDDVRQAVRRGAWAHTSLTADERHDLELDALIRVHDQVADGELEADPAELVAQVRRQAHTVAAKRRADRGAKATIAARTGLSRTAWEARGRAIRLAAADGSAEVTADHVAQALVAAGDRQTTTRRTVDAVRQTLAPTPTVDPEWVAGTAESVEEQVVSRAQLEALRDVLAAVPESTARLALDGAAAGRPTDEQAAAMRIVGREMRRRGWDVPADLLAVAS